jgi:hypothetical protein
MSKSMCFIEVYWVMVPSIIQLECCQPAGASPPS